MSRICDIRRAADHIMKFPTTSPSIFAYCKQQKIGGVDGLGMRLGMISFIVPNHSARRAGLSCAYQYLSFLAITGYSTLYSEPWSCRYRNATDGYKYLTENLPLTSTNETSWCHKRKLLPSRNLTWCMYINHKRTHADTHTNGQELHTILGPARK